MQRLYMLIGFVLGLLSVANSQCNFDAHNTSIGSHWISCEVKANPLTTLPASHWIMYEFEEVSSIDEITIWNVNHPDNLGSGASAIRMDISEDGANWQTLDTIQLSMATGDPDYFGTVLEEFKGMSAQYVLLTLLENHGGSCVGLGEVKFRLGSVISADEEKVLSNLNTWPNPADQKVSISLTNLKGKIQYYQVTDIMGRIISRQEVRTSTNINQLDIETAELTDGHYVISISSDEGRYAQPIVVVHPK